MNDVTIRRRSMTGETEAGTWSNVNRSASGNSSQKTSRQRSPPRIPVSQSCTRATFMAQAPARRSAGRARHPLSPVVQELRERALEGNLGLPSRRLLDLGGIAFQDHDIGRTESSRIGLDGDTFHRALRQEKVYDLLDRPRTPRTEVVDLAGFASLEQKPVASHDVAHVGEIAPRLEIPDPHDRLTQPGLDLGDLLGDVGFDEHFSSTRPGVVERATADDGQPVAFEILIPHQVLSDLADGVGREGPQLVGLADREFLLVHHAVLFAAPDREETRFEPKRADRFQQVDLSVDVRRERLRRSLPRGAHEALRREVDHVRRLDGIDELSDRGEIPQIGFDERDTRSKVLDRLRLASPAARSEDESALTERVFGHVAADETRDARDEKPHRRYYTGGSGD